LVDDTEYLRNRGATAIGAAGDIGKPTKTFNKIGADAALRRPLADHPKVVENRRLDPMIPRPVEACERAVWAGLAKACVGT
jgi:hypothetical protein